MLTVLRGRISTTKNFFSTLAEPLQRLEIFRTSENDPSRHTENHLGQFYRIPNEDTAQIFSHGGIPKSYEIQTKTFNETVVMVRKPALEIINLMKRIDYTKPTVRLVLYGDVGCGKSMSLVHILHYGFRNNYLLVHIPWVNNWMLRCKESSNSEVKEGFIDINIDAATWLIHFKTQNAHLLSDSELKLSEDCVWNHREKILKGAPFLELIDHGINRVKYASRCVGILCEEIKRASIAGKCKTLVAIDGFNAFYTPRTNILTEKKEKVLPGKITLTEPFQNITRFDWNNGIVVVTVDKIGVNGSENMSFLPKTLLTKEGFEHMDPFIPISVPNYTPKEFKSYMDYLRERRWVKETEGQDEELAFLSSSNPYQLMMLCKSL